MQTQTPVAEKHYHVAEGRTVDQFLRQAAELVRSRTAGDLVNVVERLACCCSDREKSLVCLVHYRGLDNARAADVLGITVHQAKDALRSAVKRYQALTITRKLEFDLVNGDRVVGGEEMTLAELEALDGGPTAAGRVQERTAAGGMMNGAGMSEDAVERALREAERYENGRSKRASGGEVESCIEGPLKALR